MNLLDETLKSKDMSTICPSLVIGSDIEHKLILSLKSDYPEYFI